MKNIPINLRGELEIILKGKLVGWIWKQRWENLWEDEEDPYVLVNLLGLGPFLLMFVGEELGGEHDCYALEFYFHIWVVSYCSYLFFSFLTNGH